MNYNVVTPISTYPISLNEARVHLRIAPYGDIELHPDDDYVTALIGMASQWIEEYLRRSIATKTIEVYIDEFSKKIDLPFLPVQSVESIIYRNRDGNLITLADTIYRLKSYNDSASLVLIENQNYPSDISSEDGSSAIRIVTGYTNGESPDTYPLPMPIKAAMFLIIGHLYENRQEDVLGNTRISFNSLPMGVKNLIQSYRLGLGL